MPGSEAQRRILGRITSINVRKVLWTADELGLRYEREDWGLPLRDPNTPAFLALNPNALVPVLVEGGTVLWESHAIMRFFAEDAAPGTAGLVPAARQERGLMSQWLDWQQTELVPGWAYAYRALGRRMPGFEDTEKIAASLGRWAHLMGILDAALADGRPYIAGDSFSLADITLGLAVHRWARTPFDKPTVANVDAYYARLTTRPAALPYTTEKTP